VKRTTLGKIFQVRCATLNALKRRLAFVPPNPKLSDRIVSIAGEPHWTHVPTDEYGSHLKRMGNLALLDKELNEQGGNQPFSDKAKALAKSKLLLTREVGALPSWDIKAIDDRQAQLAQLAVKAWPLKAS
jgi:hypothetical protein